MRRGPQISSEVLCDGRRNVATQSDIVPQTELIASLLWEQRALPGRGVVSENPGARLCFGAFSSWTTRPEGLTLPILSRNTVLSCSIVLGRIGGLQFRKLFEYYYSLCIPVPPHSLFFLPKLRCATSPPKKITEQPQAYRRDSLNPAGSPGEHHLRSQSGGRWLMAGAKGILMFVRGVASYLVDQSDDVTISWVHSTTFKLDGEDIRVARAFSQTGNKALRHRIFAPYPQYHLR